MKYIRLILAIVFTAFLAGMLSSCRDELAFLNNPEHPNYPPTIAVDVDTLREVKILFIGHSFVTDALTHVNDLCVDRNTDVSDMAIYFCKRGGANFKSWVNCWNDCDVKSYSVVRVLKKGMYIRDVACGNSAGTDGSAFRNAIINHPWDIIVFCNGTDESEDWEDVSKGGYMGELERIIREHQPAAKFYYLFPHMRWLEDELATPTLVPYSNTQQSWKVYAERIKWLEQKKGFELIIPVGTAIENLRMTNFNHAKGTPTYNLTRDGIHLGTGLAQYTASCCVYEKLIAPRKKTTMAGNTLRPDGSDREEYRFPTGCIEVTDENAPVAQQAALDAVAKPYQLTKQH